MKTILIPARPAMNKLATVNEDIVRWDDHAVTIKRRFYRGVDHSDPKIATIVDVKLVCSDGTLRTLRLFKNLLDEDQIEIARLFMVTINDAIKENKKVILAVAGKSSMKQWFCDMAVEGTEDTRTVVVQTAQDVEYDFEDMMMSQNII